MRRSQVVAVADGLLGDEAAGLYEATGADLSMVAADVAEVGLAPWPSVMAVLVDAHATRLDDIVQRIDETLGSMGAVTSEGRTVGRLRAGRRRAAV
ncbi:MAG: hypothetical protein R3C32_13705 [Chloroflexota bacterium]